jgi:hypothetical protein
MHFFSQIFLRASWRKHRKLMRVGATKRAWLRIGCDSTCGKKQSAKHANKREWIHYGGAADAKKLSPNIPKYPQIAPNKSK